MLILGLGSNRGDRLSHLRNALTRIKKMEQLVIKQVSPVYQSDALLPEKAPSTWNDAYLNCALLCKSKQDPRELLAQIKQIENELGREQNSKRWGPRVIDIDILAIDDQVIQTDVLHVPHDGLLTRPFALWPLADVAPLWMFPLPGPHYGKTASELCDIWGSRFDGHAPLHTKQIQQRIDTPELVGILNITPDSFSDGGQFCHAEQALAQASTLVNAGATVLDIGAEATSPHALSLTHEEEWMRIQPILSAILSAQDHFFLKPKISIDTRHYQTAELALSLGVDWINDVTGLTDPLMRKVVSNAKAHCVVMHHVSIPADKNKIIPRNKNPIEFIFDWAHSHLEQLEREGISRDKIIFDPGIGFGKSAEHSLLLFKNADFFSKLNTRLLIGHSRKSFLSLFTSLSANERDIETASSVLSIINKVDYVRVHNVDLCARGFKIKRACD
jgi:2-amino-4-hydroxy-6-hydroxymethyldihydropteridine diphosphokinase/dihydropteroate synthase